MVSTILGLVSLLFTLAGKIFDWLYAKQMVDAGKTAQQVADLKEQVDAAHKALLAREAIRADVAKHPDRVPEHDPFLRD